MWSAATNDAVLKIERKAANDVLTILNEVIEWESRVSKNYVDAKRDTEECTLPQPRSYTFETTNLSR